MGSPPHAVKRNIQSWPPRGQIRLLGVRDLTEKQRAFLEWLVMTPRERDEAGLPETQAAWARQHGVNPRTLREWKANSRFRAEWDRLASERNVSTERVQRMLDALYETAIEQRDVQAMKAWLEYSARLRPPKKPVLEGDYAKLSDEELVREITELLGVVRG